MLISVGVKHELCAENEQDKKEWFDILSMHIEMMIPVDDTPKAPKTDTVRGSSSFALHFRP